MLAKTSDILVQAQRELAEEQAKVARSLMYVYPIVTFARNSLTIRSVPLPNSDFEENHDPLTVAAALGWIASIMQLLTFILAYPTRYHLTPLGSRSTIQDPVSRTVYPLYEQNVSPFAFEFGVFLLNNCIAEMLEARGVAVHSLHMTLGNLRSLIHHISLGSMALDSRGRPSPLVGPGMRADVRSTRIPLPFARPTAATSTSTIPLAHSPSTVLHLPGALQRSALAVGHSPTLTPTSTPGEPAISPLLRASGSSSDPSDAAPLSSSPGGEISGFVLQSPRRSVVGGGTSGGGGAASLRHARSASNLMVPAHGSSPGAEGVVGRGSRRGLARTAVASIRASGEWTVVNGQLKQV
ncbi:hypothetical protein BC828DRAFT_141613 [Blastocladiella britannica]|nr:hypothetical protein BC828DRAFT_141613 [Blastocladiella britannica]